MEKLAMLSDGEFDIMECVWSCPQAPTQTGIMHWVNEKNSKSLKVATIATYIRRIMWKGYLEKVDNHDGHPVYRALVSRDEYFDRNSKDFAKRWGCDKVIQMAMSCFAGKSQEERDEFADTIKKG